MDMPDIVLGDVRYTRVKFYLDEVGKLASVTDTETRMVVSEGRNCGELLVNGT